MFDRLGVGLDKSFHIYDNKDIDKVLEVLNKVIKKSKVLYL